MKYFSLLSVFLSVVLISNGQSTSTTERKIRELEQTIVQAILSADTNTLKKVWAPEFLVNNPRNNITGNRDSVFITLKAGMIDYSRFERIIERVQIQQNIVITMGYENIVSRRDIPEAKAGQIYKRRFTNIWMLKADRWQQIARHASIICR